MRLGGNFLSHQRHSSLFRGEYYLIVFPLLLLSSLFP